MLWPTTSSCTAAPGGAAPGPGRAVLGMRRARGRPSSQRAGRRARRGRLATLPGNNVLSPGPPARSPPRLLTGVFFTVCRSASTTLGAGLPLAAPGEAHVSISLVIKTKHRAALPALQLTGQRRSSGLVVPEASAPSGLQEGWPGSVLTNGPSRPPATGSRV